MSSRSKTLVKLALAKAQKDTLELLAIPRYESQTTLPEEREKAIKETTFDPETKITSCPASFDSTQEDKDKSITNIQHRPRAKISERMTWTEPQRKNALHFFKKEISNCKVPGKERCTEFIGNNPDLKHIHWKKVKQFVHNYLNKIRKKLN